MSYPKEAACHFIGVGGVVFHNDHVFLVKLTYGPAKGRWLIPGGLVDCGETLQEAIKREIREESGGLEIEPMGIIGIRSMVREVDNLTDLYCIFICHLISDPEPLVKDRDEIGEILWMPLQRISIDPEVTEYTRRIVEKALTDQSMKVDKEWGSLAKKRIHLKKYEHFWATV